MRENRCAITKQIAPWNRADASCIFFVVCWTNINLADLFGWMTRWYWISRSANMYGYVIKMAFLMLYLSKYNILSTMTWVKWWLSSLQQYTSTSRPCRANDDLMIKCYNLIQRFMWELQIWWIENKNTVIVKNAFIQCIRMGYAGCDIDTSAKNDQQQYLSISTVPSSKPISQDGDVKNNYYK